MKKNKEDLEFIEIPINKEDFESMATECTPNVAETSFQENAICPIHGKTGLNWMSIEITDENNLKHTSLYCLKCLNELLLKHLTPLKVENE